MPNKRSTRNKKDTKTKWPLSLKAINTDDITKTIADMDTDNVGIEVRKFIVYTMERMVYGPDQSEEFTTFCISCYFILGEKKYRGLSNMYNLPSIESIRDHSYEEFKISAGLSNKLLQLIKVKTENLLPQRKDCILEMDEIYLEPDLKFNEYLDCIVGYEDDGETRTANPAQYATHIWVHSIGGAWLMPLCFIFTKVNSTPEQIKRLLFNSVAKLEEIGLDVVGLVTKMRVNFHAFMTQLGVTPEDPTFKVGSKEVVFLFEAPQLMNVTRNMMMKYKFKLDEHQSSWKHVKKLFANECQEKGQRKTKLQSKHVKPTVEERAIPRYAIETLSNSVATEMRSQVSAGKLPADAAGTAEIIDLFNKLFDMFNSTEEFSTNDYNNSFKGTKKQFNFCRKMVTFFNNLSVYNSQGKDCTDEVNFINCWLITIMGLLKLWDTIKKKDHPFMLTRNICCDGMDKFMIYLSTPGLDSLKKPTPPKFLEMYTQFLISSYFTNEDMVDEDEDFHLTEFVKQIYKRVPAIRHDPGTPKADVESAVNEELNARFRKLMKDLINLTKKK